MPRNEFKRRIDFRLVLLCACLSGISLPALADWRDDVGFQEYEQAFAGSPPNGAGLAISQVEAPQGDNGPYLPDAGFSQFLAESDPFSQPVNFIDGSPSVSNSSPSDHATFTVGQTIYGNTVSLAGGANQITVYEANDFLNNFLRIGGGQPGTPTYVVQNHSWVGELSSTNSARSALRRLDSIIDNSEVIMLVGLGNNGSVSNNINPDPDASHPQLFCQQLQCDCRWTLRWFSHAWSYGQLLRTWAIEARSGISSSEYKFGDRNC